MYSFPSSSPLLLPLLLLLGLHSTAFWPVHAGNGAPELFPLEGQQSPIRIALGTRGFKLSCPVKIGSEEEEEKRKGEEGEGEEQPELIIKWTKEGQPVGDGERFRLANRDRDLRLRLAQHADSGLYKCTAINEWGHRSVEFRVEVLDERGRDLAEGMAEIASAPIWKQPLGPQPRLVRVQAGQSLQLECPPASGYPPPQATWIRRGQKDQEVAVSALLSLKQVWPQDAGIYACQLRNSLGSIRSEFSVQVTEEFDAEHGQESGETAILLNPSGNLSPGSSVHSVLSPPPPPPPRIEQPQRMKAGNTAQLQCRVEWRGEGDKAVIRWLRQVESAEAEAVRRRTPNATLLRLGEMSLLMLDQGADAVRLEEGPTGLKQFLNELRIPNVRKEDSGRYFCVVTNPAGQFVYGSALLSVFEPPPMLPFPNSSLVRLLLLSSIGLLLCSVPLLCWFLCTRRCRPQGEQSTGKCHPAANTSSSSASNTFASCSSASSSNSATKALASVGQQQLPPPPPRVPPPLLPPSASFNTPQVPRQLFQQNIGGTFWPSSTLDRQMERPQMLHRTRAEDEMSRMSSHIYASGSPLPPVHVFHQPDYPGIYPANPTSFPQPQTPQLAVCSRDYQFGGQLPPSTLKISRKMERIGPRMAGEEQKMPLIEAQRQSAELWRGN